MHKIRENDFYNKEYGIENGKSTSAIKDSYILRLFDNDKNSILSLV